MKPLPRQKVVPVPPDPRLVKSVGKEFRYAIDRRKPFWKRVGAFVRGENKAGRKLGAVLDIATIFLPGGIRTGRQAAQIILQRKTQPPMKNAIRRALSGDGGSFLKVRNENGAIDAAAIGATLIRVAIVVGIFYACQRMGLNPADVLDFIIPG